MRAVASVWPYITKKTRACLCRMCRNPLHHVGRHAPARLGQGFDRWRQSRQQAGAFHQLIAVRHARKTGDALARDQRLERVIPHAPFGQDNRSTYAKMRIQDRQPEGVGWMQGCDGAIAGAQVEIFGNCMRVGIQVRAAQPHQLGAARRSRCGEHHRKARMRRGLPVQRGVIEPPAIRLADMGGIRWTLRQQRDPGRKLRRKPVGQSGHSSR